MRREWLFLGASLVLLAMLCSACCKGGSAPTVSQVEWVPKPCMEKSPPAPPTPDVVGHFPCPTETCLDADNTARLYLYLAELQRWARGAWRLCGPEAVTDEVNGAEAPEGEPR